MKEIRKWVKIKKEGRILICDDEIDSFFKKFKSYFMLKVTFLNMQIHLIFY